MAELADAHGSGPCGSNTMRVQVSFPALHYKNIVFYDDVFCLSILSFEKNGDILLLMIEDFVTIYISIQMQTRKFT